ncbi:MAG: hypothetical protein ACRC6V_03450 [Bacteroidales bacterium]
MFICLSLTTGRKPSDVSRLILSGAQNKGIYTAAEKNAPKSCWRHCSQFLSKVIHNADNFSLVILNLGTTPAHAIVVDSRSRIVADSLSSYYVSGSVDEGTLIYKAPVLKYGKMSQGPAMPFTVSSKVLLAHGLRTSKEP